MNNRLNRATALLTLLIAGACLTTAYAAEPPVFKETGLVTGLAETHDEPCKQEGGGGAAFDHWDIYPRKTEFDIKVNSDKARHLDLYWRWPHELQDPDFHIINLGKPPIPADICKQAAVKIEDYLFLFAIHNLVTPTPKGLPKSPHALVYIPMHVASGGNPEDGDEFYLFVFHIESDSTECDEETAGYPRERCLALRRLFVKNVDYLNKKITEHDLVYAIRNEIGKIIPEASTSTAPKDVQPRAVRLHNGIIHGTLGGG